MKAKLTLSTAMAALLLCSSSFGAVILTPSDSRVVSAAGTQTARNINTTGHPSQTYVIRTRNNANDTNQIIATFIRFDVSSLTVADVNSSGFQASFNIDHVTTLGTSSNPNTFFVARNTTDTWTWDSSGDNNPLYSWIDDSVALGIFGDTFSGNSPIPTTLSLDITSAVQGWVNGTSDNLGLII
ncbi:MAG: hypothetical protein ACNA8L_08490 [Luteolibacter sp.]